MVSATIFDSWLDAPFLKELTGKQLYSMIVAVKEKSVTGECECYVEDGKAFVLHFVDGQPTFDREKAAEILKRPSVVAAWMPGKVSDPQVAAEPLVSDEHLEILKSKIDAAPCFRADDHWIVLMRNADKVYSSDEHASGVNLATGLVAEINGAFLELTRGKPLQRFSLDVGGSRFGFETLGGDWSAVIRANTISQNDALDCTRILKRKLEELEINQGEFKLESRGATPSEARYCMVRPQLYQRAERRILESIQDIDAPWDQFWFQYDDDVIYTNSKTEESKQERGGALSDLNTLIRQGFERLTETPASNFVLYAHGVTVWCDFFKQGFWATRFTDDKNGYRQTAEQIARSAWPILRETF